MPAFGQRTALRGASEREVLDWLLERARSGSGGVLVLRGEAGIGKTALLDDLVARASGCRIMRAVGVQSDMELPSPPCISSAAPCSMDWSACLRRSARRFGWHSDSPSGLHRTASWSVW